MATPPVATDAVAAVKKESIEAAGNIRNYASKIKQGEPKQNAATRANIPNLLAVTEELALALESGKFEQSSVYKRVLKFCRLINDDNTNSSDMDAISAKLGFALNSIITTDDTDEDLAAYAIATLRQVMRHVSK